MSEDGIGGICDSKQLLCFAFAFWNERDPILKERLFGLTGPQGNHGEDVKEVYFYDDNTPTHSYMRMTYRYPQAAFPYQELVRQNAARSKRESEFEIADTGVFAQGFFEIESEYAKQSAADILIQVRVENRGPEKARLHLPPTLWFRNTWSWGRDDRKPHLRLSEESGATPCILASHYCLGDYKLACEGAEAFLFTENESNSERLWGAPNANRFVKDGINDFVVQSRTEAVNPDLSGTKGAAHYQLELNPG